MHLNPEPYNKIAAGLKTIELRLNDEKRQMIEISDTIVFSNLENEETIEAKVIALHRFNSFEELYADLDLLKCGYTKVSIDTAKAEDMEKYYSKEKQQKYGVLGIEITLC